MHRPLLLCLALAACEDAVVIEVHAAPGLATNEVQLFIGLGVCDDCPGIQPPQTPEILPGAVYYREAANPQVRVAQVEGGVATFRIEPADGVDHIDLAVAVDANGQSAAIIQQLSLASAGRYRVDLLPAGGKLGIKPQAADGNFVSIWRQPTGGVPCMGFERWAGGTLEGERIFIVPEDDLDCDGRVANECAPYGFDAVGVPPLPETSCTTLAPLAAGATVCKLGGPACDDATGAPRACAPTEYCLPSQYCDLANLDCDLPQNRDRCLFDTDPSPETILDCTVPFRTVDLTHDDVCAAGGFAKFNIRQPAGTSAPVACIGPEQDLLLERPIPGQPLAFTDTVKQLSTDAGNTRVVEMRLHWDGGCTYKMEFQGEKAPGVMKPDVHPTFAQFWVTQNGGGLRKVLVPVVLHYTNDCGTPASCTLTLETENSVAKCLR